MYWAERATDDDETCDEERERERERAKRVRNDASACIDKNREVVAGVGQGQASMCMGAL